VGIQSQTRMVWITESSGSRSRLDRGVADRSHSLVTVRAIRIDAHFRVRLGAVLRQDVLVFDTKTEPLRRWTVPDVRRVEHKGVVDAIVVDVDHANAPDTAFPPADVVVEDHTLAAQRDRGAGGHKVEAQSGEFVAKGRLRSLSAFWSLSWEVTISIGIVRQARSC
jgi:hypothetical protein